MQKHNTLIRMITDRAYKRTDVATGDQRGLITDILSSDTIAQNNNNSYFNLIFKHVNGSYGKIN